MKNKAGLILLILIIIATITSGCTGDKLQRADEYMSKGNMKKAEKLYKKLILEKNNQGGYKGLIKIYESQNQMEKLSEIVERSIEDGHIYNLKGQVIYDSVTNAFTMAKVLSFKDKREELIYSEGIKDLDIDIEIISEKSYRIYSMGNL